MVVKIMKNNNDSHTKSIFKTLQFHFRLWLDATLSRSSGELCAQVLQKREEGLQGDDAGLTREQKCGKAYHSLAKQKNVGFISVI